MAHFQVHLIPYTSIIVAYNFSLDEGDRLVWSMRRMARLEEEAYGATREVDQRANVAIDDLHLELGLLPPPIATLPLVRSIRHLIRMFTRPRGIRILQEELWDARGALG